MDIWSMVFANNKRERVCIIVRRRRISVSKHRQNIYMYTYILTQYTCIYIEMVQVYNIYYTGDIITVQCANWTRLGVGGGEGGKHIIDVYDFSSAKKVRTNDF